MSRISQRQLEAVLQEYCTLRPDRATLTSEQFVIHAEPIDFARKALLTFGLTVIGGGALFGLFLSGRAYLDPEMSSRGFFILAGLGLFVAALWLILIIVSGTSQRRVVDLRTGVVTTRSMIRTKKWTDLTRVEDFREVPMLVKGVPVSTHLFLNEVRPAKKRRKKVYFLAFSTSESFLEFEPVIRALIARF